MVLTGRQRKDLNAAIYDYLVGEKHSAAAEAFLKDAGVDGKADGKKILEKKWTSVLRLSKKVMELEEQVKAAEEINSAFKAGRRPKNAGLGVPVAPAKFVLKGHRAQVNAVAFHPVFTNVVVTASEDASVRVWDAETGEYERALKGHTNVVQDVAFDDKGAFLATCSADMSVKVWDFTSYDCVRTLLGHEHNVSGVAYRPGGDQIVSASRDKTLRVWEAATGQCLKTLRGHDEWVRKISLTEAGLCASVSNDQSVRVWNLDSGKCLHDLRLHSHVVECCHFAPAAVNLSMAKRKRVEAGEDYNDVVKEEAAPDADAGPAGRFLATGGRDKMIYITDAQTGVRVMEFKGHDNWVRAVRFSPNGRFLFSCSDDRTVRVWDLISGREAKKIGDAHEHFVSCLDISQQRIVITGCVDNTAKLWTE